MRFILLSVLCFWVVRVAQASERIAPGDLALAQCYEVTKLVQIAEVSSDGVRAHVQFFAPGDTANCGVVYKRSELQAYRSVASVSREAWFGLVKKSFKLGDQVVLTDDERALGTIVDLDDNGLAQVRFEDAGLDAKLGQRKFNYIDIMKLAHF